MDERAAEDARILRRSTCGHDGCTKQASYGFTRNNPLSCAEHVYGSMRRVTHLCKFVDDGILTCYKSALYGPKGKGNGGISCRLHRDEMARMYGGLCLKTGKECQTTRCCGIGVYISSTDRSYFCGKCVPRHGGGIVDPMYTWSGNTHTCKITAHCTRQATYCTITDGTEKRIACAQCSKKYPGMYRRVLAPSETCVSCIDLFASNPEHVKKRRVYGLADPTINETLVGTALYCDDCKPDGAVDLINPVCATPYCLVQVSKRGTSCTRCTERSRARKKELAVGEALGAVSDAWINNKTMPDKSCSRLIRPDFRLDLWDRTVIVECNEYAHSRYPASCETSRIIDIHGSSNGVPVILVSFNPDKKTISGTPIGSGSPSSLRLRLGKLIDVVRDAMTCPVTQGMLQAWYLYHGEYIPFLDAHRPAESNNTFLEHDGLRRFVISTERGITKDGIFHPCVDELPKRV